MPFVAHYEMLNKGLEIIIITESVVIIRTPAVTEKATLASSRNCQTAIWVTIWRTWKGLKRMNENWPGHMISDHVRRMTKPNVICVETV